MEFENHTYVAGEGDGLKKICLITAGYGFSVDIIATYQDGSTEGTTIYSAALDKHCDHMHMHFLIVIGVDVSNSSGVGSTCVSIEIRDDEAVSNAANISLTLRAENDRVSTGPVAMITVLDDDGQSVLLDKSVTDDKNLMVLFSDLIVVFTNDSYEVVEGKSIPVCVKTDGDLRRDVHLFLFSTGKIFTSRVYFYCFAKRFSIVYIYEFLVTRWR